MALLGAAFSIGRSALAAYQGSIAITGQNIANVGNPDYTRQTGRLTTLLGGPTLGGVRPGGGVQIAQLRRHVDEAVENRLRISTSDRSSRDVVYRTLSQTEALYNELTEYDVSTQIGEFFGSFGQIQTEPQNSGYRNLAISSADALIGSLKRQRSGLIQQVRDLNQQAITDVEAANGLMKQIGELNVAVAEQESDGVTTAAALRDQRDAALRRLSEIVDIQVREQPNKAINVYIGSVPVVEFNRVRELRVDTVLEDGLEISRVRFNDDGGTAIIRGGSLGGVIESRDRHILWQLDRMDQLAAGLIFEVNKIHAQGTGLVGYNQVTGSYAVADVNEPLSSKDAELPFPVKNGTFLLKVRDTATGQITTHQIEVDLDGLNGDDTTLASLAADLDAIPGVSASVTSDLKLSLTADSGKEFFFAEDSSDVLAALGVGSFFVGEDAASIDVNPLLRSDPRLIAASASGELQDGVIAGKLAALQGDDKISGQLNNQSLLDFHSQTIGQLAVEAGAALVDLEAEQLVYEDLYAQREAASGVSIDEEAINLTKFETAFQAASRYIGVLGQMTDELLTIVR